jgi:hypothetical protein
VTWWGSGRGGQGLEAATVAREWPLRPASGMPGTIVLLLHDEILAECKEADAKAVAGAGRDRGIRGTMLGRSGVAEKGC